MRQLRVALVVEPTSEATQRHVATLARALAERGGHATVYGAAGLRSDLAGTELVELEITATAGPRDATSVARLRRALRGQPVDVVHAVGLRAALLASLARPAGAPLVVTWPVLGPRRGLARLARLALARTAAGAADVVLCPTPELVAAAGRLGARETRLHPLGAPALAAPARGGDAVRAEFDLPPAAPLVLAAGRLRREHRHDVLVEAAARWRALSPPATVIIAGTGPTYRALAGQIIVARAPVILAGERPDLADLLHAADVAVVAGETDAGSRFAQEALVAGVPLVCTAVDGVVELVGGAAVLVPPGDVDALDEAVRGLLSHPERRSARAAAGLARAREWPSEAEAAAAVLLLYAELAPDPVGAPALLEPAPREPVSREPGRDAEPTRDAPRDAR